jgi:gliding motility-associated-like protein
MCLEIIDVEIPEISCPPNQTQATNTACNINLNNFVGDAIVVDNCSSAQNISINQLPSSGSVHSGVGTIIQVTLTATDEAGNFNSCVFDVELIDTTAPEAFCPTNQTVNADANCDYVLTDFSASVGATDNCTGLGNFIFSHQTPVGTIYNTGVHEIFMQAEDESGNIGACSFTIEVLDVIAPIIIDCAPDQIVALESGCEGSMGDYTNLVNAADACDGTNLLITQNPSFGTLISANTSVTITVEDLSGNIEQCVFNVVVEDQEDPVLTCPADTLVNVNAVCEYDAPDLTSVVSGLDNCSMFGDMIITQSPTVGTLLNGADQIEVTLTDESGNSASCTIDILPNDIIAPEIECPSDEVINNGASCTFNIPDYTGLAVIIENCPDFTLVQDPAVGSTLQTGQHDVSISITDIAGNEATCTFMIEVIENVAPTITCPLNISQCDPEVTYSTPVATDNCAVALIEQTDLSGFTSGDIFPVGITIQTYEVTDVSGNSASCSFTIEVLESPDTALITNTPTSLCDTTSVVLNAEAIQSGTGEWFVVTGNATLNNQFANVTGANNLSFGVNQFVWEVSSSQCGSTSDTIEIVVYGLPFPASIPNDSLIVCYDTLVNLSANTPNVGQGTWYSPNSSISFVNNNLSNTAAFNLAFGWNDIIWEISNGTCPVSTDTVRVFTIPRAIISTDDTTLCATNNSLQILGNSPPPSVQSGWYLSEGNATIVSSSSPSTELINIGAGLTGVVYAMIHPTCGTTHDTLFVVVEQCEEYNPVIPTVFTPNNDGKNDVFIVDNLHALYPECEVKIVNRWGNLVFESIGYLNPWDGTMLGSGELLPTGTYFYRIYLNDDIRREITGPISIIR